MTEAKRNLSSVTSTRREFRCACGRPAIYRKFSLTIRCGCGAVIYIDENGIPNVDQEGDGEKDRKWIPGSACVHRGEALRKMEGKCCGGRQIVDVFACSIHGECTHRNTKAGDDKTHACLGCDDWKKPTT